MSTKNESREKIKCYFDVNLFSSRHINNFDSSRFSIDGKLILIRRDDPRNFQSNYVTIKMIVRSVARDSPERLSESVACNKRAMAFKRRTI